jgi:amino acid transporter, AAT family
VAAILLAIYAPARAFLALYGTAVAGMLFIWIVILFTYVQFRRTVPRTILERLPLTLPTDRFAAGFGIVALLAIALTTFFVDGLRYSIPLFVPFLLIMSAAYLRTRGSARREVVA